jgi:hypothetical protein
LICWWRALVCICAYIPRVSEFEVFPYKYLTFKINKQPQAVEAKECQFLGMVLTLSR